MINLKQLKVGDEIPHVNNSVDLSTWIDLVEGDVNSLIGKLPIRFTTVEYNFDIEYNSLISLEGCPRWIGGTFRVSHNLLRNLVGGPEEVRGDCYVTSNNLTSLIGSPKVVGGDFLCGHNRLKSLEGAPEVIGGNLIAHHNPLVSVEGLPKKIKRDIVLPMSIIKYFSNDLIAFEDAIRSKCDLGGNIRYV